MNLNIKLSNDNGRIRVEYKVADKRVRRVRKEPYNATNLKYFNKNIIPKIQEGILNGYDFLAPSQNDAVMLSHYLDKVMKKTKLRRTVATIEAYSVAVDKINEFFKNKPISEIKPVDIDSFVLDMEENGYTGNTIRLYMTPLNQALMLALKYGDINSNPAQFVDKPPKNPKKKVIPTLIVLERMLSLASGSFKTYLHIAIFTGLRASEIMALKWSDLDFKKETISVTKRRQHGIDDVTKNKRSWKAKMSPTLKKYLLSIETKYEYIVVNKNGFPYLGSSNALNMLRTFIKQHGLCEGCTTHSFRHAFVSLMIQAKENPKLIQNFLGHTNMTMINEVYSHHIEDDNDMLNYEKMWQKLGS